MSLYNQRGVSSEKEEVHKAIRSLSTGLYPRSFCKIFPDRLGKDSEYVNVMHADGAGTKSILAYLYWKETGDVSVWKGIARDAIVMNLDDLLCAGIHDNIVFTSTIDRNKLLITGDVLEAIIEGSATVFDELRDYGISIDYLGGETADVGDVVRTIAVNGTMCSRWPYHRVITNARIAAGDVIVGFASYGKAGYESEYNSGIGSNGLTSARHDMLCRHYAQFTETYDPALPSEVVYTGPYRLSDTIPLDGNPISIGKLLLSPTRTFAPLVKKILVDHFDDVHGLVHSSGGGQTKCLKFIMPGLEIVKEDMLPVPPVFELIKKHSGASNTEMYRVFNMGCRLELFCKPDLASSFLKIAETFNIAARVIGRVQASASGGLTIRLPEEELFYKALF